jgi:hypothetical protein
MEDQRKGILGFLLFIGISSVILLIFALYIDKYDIVISSLTVIATCMSTAFAYDVIYQTKINQLPVINLTFDCHSRYQLWQLVITNIGGGAAFNVKIEWLEYADFEGAQIIKPRNRELDVVCFSKEPVYNKLASLPKGSSHYIG